MLNFHFPYQTVSFTPILAFTFGANVFIFVILVTNKLSRKKNPEHTKNIEK